MGQIVSIQSATDQKNWTVSGKIIKKGEIKTGTKPNGEEWAMCTITLKDDSGEGQITLWNDEIEKVQFGKSYALSGYTREHEDKKYLQLGKWGKIQPLTDDNQTTIDDSKNIDDDTPVTRKITNETIYEKQQLILDCIAGIFRIMVDLQLAKAKDLPNLLEDKSS